MMLKSTDRIIQAFKLTLLESARSSQEFLSLDSWEEGQNAAGPKAREEEPIHFASPMLPAALQRGHQVFSLLFLFGIPFLHDIFRKQILSILLKIIRKPTALHVQSNAVSSEIEKRHHVIFGSRFPVFPFSVAFLHASFASWTCFPPFRQWPVASV